MRARRLAPELGGASGTCVNLGQGPEAHHRLVEVLLRGGFGRVALDHLRVAVEEYPGDSLLVSTHRQILQR